MAERKLEAILAATDFSESAEGAIDWAVGVARTHGAKLLLVHALHDEAERERCREALEERAATLRSSGTPVECRLVVGAAARAVIEVAEEAAVDLVVAGTRGQTGLKRIYLGSTAARLVRYATCPVLTVHPEHIGQHRPIHRILVPTDYSADAGLALRAAARLLDPALASALVVLLHVYRLHPRVAYPWTPSYPAHRRSELAREARRHLETLAAPLRALGFEVQMVAQEGHPAEVIDAEAIRVAADVIAMGTHGRSGLEHLRFGSIAEHVLPAAPCPVLTVHTEASS